MQLPLSLEDKLYSAFPRLYSGRHQPERQSWMRREFKCRDGWYELLYDLSQQLTKYMEQHPQVDIEVVQISSTFGRLHFYIEGGNAVLAALIEHACILASVTCEITGTPGQLCKPDESQAHSFDQIRWIVLCPEKSKELGLVPVPAKFL